MRTRLIAWHPAPGAPLALIVLVGVFTLAGCGLGLGIQQPSGGTSTAGPQSTLTGFCSALHDSNFSQAYSYFSDHYKATITDPAQIPHMFGAEGTVSDCKEFGNGGFLHINGAQADDETTFVLTPPPFNGQASAPVEAPATMNFVESGATWQIDSITS